MITDVSSSISDITYDYSDEGSGGRAQSFRDRSNLLDLDSGPHTSSNLSAKSKKARSKPKQLKCETSKGYGLRNNVNSVGNFLKK